MGLVWSGYNSTNDLPLTYRDDSSSRSSIEWSVKVEEWPIFTKYHLHITTQDSTIETTVIRVDFTNEFRLLNLVKKQNVTQPLLKTEQILINNFTVTSDNIVPY